MDKFYCKVCHTTPVEPDDNICEACWTEEDE